MGVLFMKTKKGFSLVEMIVVLAIIGILLAVLVPTWSYFIMRANVRSQNNYSKVIFNAAQTQATREKFYEREYYSIANDTDKTITERNNAKANLFVGANDDFYIYWNGHKAFLLEADGETIDTAVTADTQAKVDAFANSVNKVFSHSQETVYKIYIKDYKVISVCSAKSENTENIGSFPKIQEDRSSNKTVQTYDMDSIKH